MARAPKSKTPVISPNMHPQPNPLHEIAGSVCFCLMLAVTVFLMLCM